MKMVAENIIIGHENTGPVCVRGGVHDLCWKVEPMREASTSRDTARSFSRYGTRSTRGSGTSGGLKLSPPSSSFPHYNNIPRSSYDVYNSIFFIALINIQNIPNMKAHVATFYFCCSEYQNV